MRNFISLATLAFLTLSLTAYDAAAQTNILRFPFNDVIFVPCANDGSGEYVSLEGTVFVAIHSVADQSGGEHYASVDKVIATGIGQTTGDVYRSVGASTAKLNFTSGSLNDLGYYKIKLVGPGPGNNYTYVNVLGSTTNANGEFIEPTFKFGSTETCR